jgi:hypothetical protein
MAVDRVDSGVDAEAEKAAERRPEDTQPPPDQPGAEGVLSRSDSRKGAIAANEKPAATDPAISESEVAASGEGERKVADSTTVSAATEAIDRENGEPGGFETSEAPRPYAERLDAPIDDDQPTPREVLRRFSPMDAGLPEVTEEEAAEYIDQNADDRPWLASAKDCDPSVQRVLVAMDQGQGHALERHEGFADDEKLQRRVTALEDPAQLDDDKRAAGIDGCKPGNKDHKCGDTATAIQDPTAFATVFSRGIEHPDVQYALQTPFEPGKVPRGVNVEIEHLLGPDAGRYCSGYRLEPVGDSKEAGQDCRSAWVEAKGRLDREPDVPDPICTPIENFHGAAVKYLFQPTLERDGYEVSTMYVEP